MRRKKSADQMNTELDLVAFISLLSVCICFLLLTTIWIQIGSMNVKQAFDGSGAAKAKQASLWARVFPDGGMQLELRNAKGIKRSLRKVKFEGAEGKIDRDGIQKHLAAIKKSVPGINQAMIQPQAKSVFDSLVGLMDVFRQEGVKDIGIVPL